LFWVEHLFLHAVVGKTRDGLYSEAWIPGIKGESRTNLYKTSTKTEKKKKMKMKCTKRQKRQTKKREQLKSEGNWETRPNSRP
jgi:hypothetical protein